MLLDKAMKWLIVLVLFTGCSTRQSVNISPAEIVAAPGMNLIGTVMSGTKPLANVAVSDGYTVVVTDEKGIYQMNANKHSRFVFVSLPADCEVPMNNGLPQIYKAIDPAEDIVIRKDFVLNQTPKKEKFFLLAMADVQIANNTDLSFLQKDILKIKDYVQGFDGKMIGISLGDLVWDNMPFFANYAQEMKKLQIPLFQVIGNHDHDLNEKDDKLASRKFEENFGPSYYSYNIGDCHFVVLDDVLYNGRKDYKGEITQEQIEWLKQDLKYVTRDKLIIIGVHIPTSRRGTKKGLNNSKQLYSLLEGYKVRILSGHTHHNFTTTITPDIEENTLGAVSGAFWTGDICNDGSPRGFAVYEIKGNEIINWHYKGTNHEPGYQMKLYAPGQSVSASLKNDVLLNVFNWHSNWTVRVTENEKDYTLLSNIKEIDTEANRTMLGKKLPTYRPFAEPDANNDHMFHYRPSPNWQYIKAEVTDPFGNVYNATLHNK